MCAASIMILFNSHWDARVLVDFGAGANYWIEDWFGLSQVNFPTNQSQHFPKTIRESVAQVCTAI